MWVETSKGTRGQELVANTPFFIVTSKQAVVPDL